MSALYRNRNAAWRNAKSFPNFLVSLWTTDICYLKVLCMFEFFFCIKLIFTSLQCLLAAPPKCVCAEHLCRDCGRGWLRFENTCYFLSQNRLTWQQSRKECQKKGGDLAVITNERVQVSKSINTVKLKLTEVISILMYSCVSTISRFCRCIWVRKGICTTGLG